MDVGGERLFQQRLQLQQPLRDFVGILTWMWLGRFLRSQWACPWGRNTLVPHRGNHTRKAPKRHSTCHPIKNLSRLHLSTPPVQIDVMHHNERESENLQVLLDLKVFSFNTHSLRNEFDELRCFALTVSLYVIAIPETFIDTTNNDSSSEYYRLFNRDRVNCSGGEVAL